ncbi:hypothetical protein [Streptomyces caniscabiei]|uniref:hypothetical protein n=1 Tax=Streptomyces caniscabiei TaxID=2746961 RepID=UPI0007659015|nr:hypothetical protein [Streptomyces caniscabiei]
MSNLPAVGADGASNGYQALQAKLTALKAAADQLRQEAELKALRTKRNSDFADVVSDLSAAAEVDGNHIAAINEVAAAFARAAGSGMRVAAAADNVRLATEQLKSVHQAQYGRVQAAVTASKARQAKPGFYRQT